MEEETASQKMQIDGRYNGKANLNQEHIKAVPPYLLIIMSHIIIACIQSAAQTLYVKCNDMSQLSFINILSFL